MRTTNLPMARGRAMSPGWVLALRWGLTCLAVVPALALAGCAAPGTCGRHLDELERRSALRAWVPQLQLAVGREARPKLEAAWTRPKHGAERVKRQPTWKRELLVLANLRWEMDRQDLAGLASVRARWARAQGRGACTSRRQRGGGRHVR